MLPLPYLDNFNGTGTLADHTSDSGHTYYGYGIGDPSGLTLSAGEIINSATGAYSGAAIDLIVTPNYEFRASVYFHYLTQINFSLPGGFATFYSSGLGPGSSSFIASSDSEESDPISAEVSIAAGNHDVLIKFQNDVVTIELDSNVILSCPSEQYDSTEPGYNSPRIAMIRYMGGADSSRISQTSMTGDSDIPPFWIPQSNCYEIP